MGITKQQHKEIVSKIQVLRWDGLKIYSYTGLEIIGVSKEKGELYLSDHTKLTHRSYSPCCRFSDALRKFYIGRIDLKDTIRLAGIHRKPGMIVFERK